jgi:ubiquinone/menaquinone biosynthesis C-methylase UbiE
MNLILSKLYKIYRYFKKYEGETTKAFVRRQKEDFFEKYFKGFGLDIGYGGMKVIKNCRGVDFEDTDVQYMEGFKNSSYDFIYSSHTLEHMNDVEVAISNWKRLIKKGGFLILYIPDRDLYEKKLDLPSQWNSDHKHFFTMYDQKDQSNSTIPIIPFISEKFNDLELIYEKKCKEGWKETAQNIHPTGEYSIELVYKKIK